ncbi:VOC family protein [Acidobacteria bacterium AB60]|nr:VOC family protein [Acidobacteria bacterium AB60]
MTTQSHTPASTVHFEKIGQIALTVSDLARAKDFYQNTLGMRFSFETGPLAFFQCGDIRLMISAGDGAQPGGGIILYFKVEDILAVYDTLRARGVSFVDTPHLIAKMPDHDLWMVFLKDPDGNVLGVMCERPRV